jgi:hypothetical protein
VASFSRISGCWGFRIPFKSFWVERRPVLKPGFSWMVHQLSPVPSAGMGTCGNWDMSTSRSCEQTNCWIWWVNVLWYAYHVSGMYQQARAFACWSWLRSWVDCRVTVIRWLFEDGKTCISIIFHLVHLL